MKIFVDTNILLDVLTGREPFYEHSAIIWSLVEERIVEGYISAISVNNVFYISKNLKGLEYAQELVDKLQPLQDAIMKILSNIFQLSKVKVSISLREMPKIFLQPEWKSLLRKHSLIYSFINRN